MIVRSRLPFVVFLEVALSHARLPPSLTLHLSDVAQSVLVFRRDLLLCFRTQQALIRSISAHYATELVSQ